MIILSTIGLIIGIALVILLSLKGFKAMIVAPIAALIIALFSQISIADFITQYATSFAGMLGGLIWPFLGAMLFAGMMEKTGMAASIAYWISDKIGAKYTATVCIIACFLLTAGGMSMSAFYVVYPIGVILCSKAGYSRNIVPAAVFAAPWTFGIYAPFVPSVHNQLMANFLGSDPARSGVIPGLVACIFMAVATIIYLEWQCRSWKKKGIEFEGSDIIDNTEEARKGLPNFWISLIPIVVVLVLFNLCGMQLIIALVIGTVVGTLLGFKKLGKDWFKVWQDGVMNCVNPMCTVCALGGLAGVVNLTPAIGAMLERLGASDMHPFISIYLGITIVGLLTGSSSGAISASMPIFQPLIQNYIAQGFSVGAIHRVAVFATGGLSALPHAGGINAAFGIWKTNHKEAYGPTFWVVVVFPIIATLGIVIPLSMLGLQ